jgi:antitoxin CptB
MNENQRTLLIKKLIYKSNNRGCKETDLILGEFSKKYLDKMPTEEMMAFEKLLSEMDADIWDWVNKKRHIPSHLSLSLIEKISENFLERIK